MELEVYLDEEVVEAEKDLDVAAVAAFPEECWNTWFMRVLNSFVCLLLSYHFINHQIT